MRPFTLLFLPLLLLATTPAAAQVNPADMRSGCVTWSNVQGLISSSLFVVPNGSRFVLTDVTLSRVAYGGPTAPGNNPIRLTINLGGTTPVGRWIVTDHGAGTDPPLDLHWTTGIVFEPSQSVEAAASVFGGGTEPNITVCWSGYLALATTTSVIPGGRSGDDLALRAWPSPMRDDTELSFILDRRQRVLLGVFSVDGRRIRTLQRGVLAAGEHRVTWDGRDDAGRPVATGVYFAELQTASGQTARRIPRLR